MLVKLTISGEEKNLTTEYYNVNYWYLIFNYLLNKYVNVYMHTATSLIYLKLLNYCFKAQITTQTFNKLPFIPKQSQTLVTHILYD